MKSSECIKLQQLGASGVVSDKIEASIELARMGLSAMGIPDSKRENIIVKYALNYYEQIKVALI